MLAAADEHEHDLEVLAEAKEYECEQYKVDAFQACEVLQAEIDMLRGSELGKGGYVVTMKEAMHQKNSNMLIREWEQG